MAISNVEFSRARTIFWYFGPLFDDFELFWWFLDLDDTGLDQMGLGLPYNCLILDYR